MNIVRRSGWLASAAALALLCGCQSASSTSDQNGAPAAESFGKPGFAVHEEDGRLWVLRDGQERSEKHVTLIGIGPGGRTIKAVDRATALEYLASVPGFDVTVVDGRLWVAKAGDGGEMPEKHVTRIGAGPAGITVKAADRSTLDAYLEAYERTSG